MIRKTIIVKMEGGKTHSFTKGFPSRKWDDLQQVIEQEDFELLPDYIYDIDETRVESVEIQDSDNLRLNEINDSSGYRRYSSQELIHA